VATTLTLHVGGPRHPSPLQEVRIVGRSEWVRSQKQLSAWQRKDWHGLHESSYCYFKVYAGTHTLKFTLPGCWVMWGALLS